jgi:hypothetical protein
MIMLGFAIGCRRNAKDRAPVPRDRCTSERTAREGFQFSRRDNLGWTPAASLNRAQPATFANERMQHGSRLRN